MKPPGLLAALVLLLASCAPAPTPAPPAPSAHAYTPPPDAWAAKPPRELGFDPQKLAAAVAFAQSRQSDWDFSRQTEVFGKPLGPLPASRAPTNGLIIRHGLIAAEFGDTSAPDPTYSVAKSYLSTLAGLAADRGLIPDPDRPVADLIHDGGYDSPHNAAVTWRHHLTQTSEWEGEMFGKPSTFIGRDAFGQAEMKPRAIEPAGARFEYNDVRINRFALSLLRVWRKPLPVVLKQEIMDPIGASSTWRWIPYDGAAVDVAGVPMPTVSGGTRWGGGLWISARDHARFGLLILRKGLWGDRRILSERWIADAARPQGRRSDYGLLWWLNTEARWPAAPRSSFSAQGAGENSIWIDPEHDLVVVWRWHKGGDSQAEFYRRILDALEDAPPRR